jgi:hypothetical protein
MSRASPGPGRPERSSSTARPASRRRCSPGAAPLQPRRPHRRGSTGGSGRSPPGRHPVAGAGSGSPAPGRSLPGAASSSMAGSRATVKPSPLSTTRSPRATWATSRSSGWRRWDSPRRPPVPVSPRRNAASAPRSAPGSPPPHPASGCRIAGPGHGSWAASRRTSSSAEPRKRTSFTFSSSFSTASSPPRARPRSEPRRRAGPGAGGPGSERSPGRRAPGWTGFARRHLPLQHAVLAAGSGSGNAGQVDRLSPVSAR